MSSSGKPRVALRVMLRVYRSVFAGTLVLTAISTVIAIALCAVKQPGKRDHPHILNALISLAGVIMSMRRVCLIAYYPYLL